MGILIPSSFYGGKQSPLSDAAPSGLFTFPLANLEGAAGTIDYTIICKNAGDTQLHAGVAVFAAVRSSAGVHTQNISEAASLENTAFTGGSLTDAWTITGAAGLVTVLMDANTSLGTLTEFVIKYSLCFHSQIAVTFL